MKFLESVGRRFKWSTKDDIVDFNIKTIISQIEITPDATGRIWTVHNGAKKKNNSLMVLTRKEDVNAEFYTSCYECYLIIIILKIEIDTDAISVKVTTTRNAPQKRIENSWLLTRVTTINCNMKLCYFPWSSYAVLNYKYILLQQVVCFRNLKRFNIKMFCWFTSLLFFANYRQNYEYQCYKIS